MQSRLSSHSTSGGGTKKEFLDVLGIVVLSGGERNRRFVAIPHKVLQTYFLVSAAGTLSLPQGLSKQQIRGRMFS